MIRSSHSSRRRRKMWTRSKEVKKWEGENGEEGRRPRRRLHRRTMMTK